MGWHSSFMRGRIAVAAADTCHPALAGLPASSRGVWAGLAGFRPCVLYYSVRIHAAVDTRSTACRGADWAVERGTGPNASTVMG